jgi:hypothetical protein
MTDTFDLQRFLDAQSSAEHHVSMRGSWDEAEALQRPLPNWALRIVATAGKDDPGVAPA